MRSPCIVAFALTLALVPASPHAGGDTTPPALSGARASNVAVVAPGVDGGPANRMRVSWTGLTEQATGQLLIFRPGGSSPIRTVELGVRAAGDGIVAWNGRGPSDELLDPGAVDWALRFVDQAGNAFTSKRRDARISFAPCGSPGGVLRRFRVSVGARVSAKPGAFAGALFRILCEPRSWIAGDEVRFVYHPEGGLHVRLYSPDDTEQRCLELVGLSVRRYYSCASSAAQEAVLNSARWFGNSRYFDDTLPVYRRMLVNHEVGHTMAQRHRSCPGDGELAPVMMQQSKGTEPCVPNPYPLGHELESLFP